MGCFQTTARRPGRGGKEANYSAWRGSLPDYLVENPWRLTCYLHGYQHKSRMDFVSSVHGNVGFLRPRKHVVQAEASMHFVIRMNADLMPHKMKSLGTGRQDVRMVLPSELNWKRT